MTQIKFGNKASKCKSYTFNQNYIQLLLYNFEDTKQNISYQMLSWDQINFNGDNQQQILRQEGDHLDLKQLTSVEDQRNNQNTTQEFQKFQILAKIFKYVVLALFLFNLCQVFINHRNSNIQKLPKRLITCAKRHKIAYIWLGQNQIPLEYQQILDACKQNIVLLGEKDLIRYNLMWNSQPDQNYHLNMYDSHYNINDRVDILKLFYLFYEGGVYSDFDKFINEECWQSYKGPQLLFTSYWTIHDKVYIPQQSFIKVNDKRNEQIKRMILLQINQAESRWTECYNRQCLIYECQDDLWSNFWTKFHRKTPSSQ